MTTDTVISYAMISVHSCGYYEFAVQIRKLLRMSRIF